MKDATFKDVCVLLSAFIAIGGLIWLNDKWRKWDNRK